MKRLARWILARILRALPVKSGLMTLTIGLGWLFGNERVTATVGGVRVRLDLSDINGRQLYLFGSPDRKVVDVCAGLLSSEDIILDIGANYGGVGFSCREASQVHMWECNPRLCDYLDEAIASNELENVFLHREAVYDCEGSMRLTVPRGHSGAGSLMSMVSSGHSEVVEVRVRDVALVMPEIVGDRPFAAKVDVEGAEPRIVPWLVAQPQLRFVLLEASHLRGLDRLWDQIVSSGLTVFGLQKRMFTTRLDPVRSAEAAIKYHDLLAARTVRAIRGSSLTVGAVARLLAREQHAGSSV